MPITASHWMFGGFAWNVMEKGIALEPERERLLLNEIARLKEERETYRRAWNRSDEEIARLKQEAQDREEFIDKRISDACAMVSMGLEKKILERDALLEQARGLLGDAAANLNALSPWWSRYSMFTAAHDAMKSGPGEKSEEAVTTEALPADASGATSGDRNTEPVVKAAGVGAAASSPTPPPPAPAAGLLARCRLEMSDTDTRRDLDDFERRAREQDVLGLLLKGRGESEAFHLIRELLGEPRP